MPWQIPTDSERCLVLDGGLATELERRGAAIRDPLWSGIALIERPELIRDVHRAYLAAGADIITTATYQATFQGFAARGIGARRAEDLMLLSVRLVRDAWDDLVTERSGEPERDGPVIAASIGPYGAFLHDGSEYRGDYGLTDRELRKFHQDRVMLLADSGADLIAFETIPTRREADVLVDLLERHGRAQAWISFSGRDGRHIAGGSPFIECVTTFEASDRVLGIGINCTAPDHAAELLRIAGPAASKPLVVYPNAGESYDAITGDWSGPPAIDWVRRYLDGFVEAGARVIGGCCRTGPEAIAEIRTGLDRYRSQTTTSPQPPPAPNVNSVGTHEPRR
jgi:homocysteine S-methyltransferase